MKLRMLKWPAHQQTTGERQKPWHWWKSFFSFLRQPVVWLVAATSLGTSCREGKIGHSEGKHLKSVSQSPVSTPLSPSRSAAEGGRRRTHLCSTHSNSQARLVYPQETLSWHVPQTGFQRVHQCHHELAARLLLKDFSGDIFHWCSTEKLWLQRC